MPQLDPRLRAGTTFHEGWLQGLSPTNEWFRIPDWFAGTWSTTSKTVDQFHDFKTGLSEQPHRTISNRWQGSRGCQRDREGNIWEFKNVPSVERVETTDTIDYKLIRDYEPIMVNDAEVSRRKVVTSISVSKGSYKILSVSQQDIIQKSVPVRAGVVRTVTSSKVFDAEGSPICLQEDQSVSARVADFSPRDYLEFTDLRKLFKEFLTAHNMIDLVPTEMIGAKTPKTAQ